MTGSRICCSFKNSKLMAETVGKLSSNLWYAFYQYLVQPRRRDRLNLKLLTSHRVPDFQSNTKSSVWVSQHSPAVITPKRLPDTETITPMYMFSGLPSAITGLCASGCASPEVKLKIWMRIPLVYIDVSDCTKYIAYHTHRTSVRMRRSCSGSMHKRWTVKSMLILHSCGKPHWSTGGSWRNTTEVLVISTNMFRATNAVSVPRCWTS